MTHQGDDLDPPVPAGGSLHFKPRAKRVNKLIQSQFNNL